jgi:hypothetical protein
MSTLIDLDAIGSELAYLNAQMRALGDRRNELATELGFDRSGKGRWICSWCSRPVPVDGLRRHVDTCASPRRPH